MTKEEAVAKVIALAEEQVGYVPYSGKKNKYAEELDKVDFFNGGSAQIGTIANGETKTFTIPTAAVTQLKNGTIKGLMLQVSDMSVRSGKGYSTNYANFYGVESTAYLPILTVVTG